MENYIIAKASHVGQIREVNEDSLGVFSTVNGQVLVVCDGMGGQAAGDLASQMSVSIVESILSDNSFPNPDDAIRSAVLAANQGVLRRAAQDASLEGMGSTCVMLIVKDGKVYAGWVGDSRIYYVANHTIRQISHDQSHVQQLIDSGQITHEEAKLHPQRNEITNCIGLDTMTAPATLPVPITPEPGSIFLLCSDGLTGMVDDARIERVLSTDNLTLQQKADRLVEMANEAGGLDNITVELLQFGTSAIVGATSGTLFDAPAASAPKKKSHLWVWIAALLVVLVAAAGAYWYFNLRPQPVQPASSKPKTEVKKKPTSKDTPKHVEKDEHNDAPKQTNTVVKTVVVNTPAPKVNQKKDVKTEVKGTNPSGSKIPVQQPKNEHKNPEPELPETLNPNIVKPKNNEKGFSLST